MIEHMRDIKVRVWDTKENKFLTNVQFEAAHDSISWGTEFFLEVKTDIEEYNPTRYIFCQSTGLKDKNGKEIYEGDILKSVEEFNAYTGMESDIYGGQIYTVEYKGKGFTLNPDPITNHLVRWPKCEVIGNIYSNPELIK